MAWALILGAAGAAGATTPLGQPMRALDSFDDIATWRVSASDDVQARLRRIGHGGGHALCLDFDFGTVSGYAVARRPLDLEYGENYEFSFAVRGDAPPNTLQFKLIDESGDNVWWVNRPDHVFTADWKRLRFKRRHIEFAWGPTQDRRLRRSAALEFAIVRGEGGGKGSVCFDELAYRELPAGKTAPLPALQASTAGADAPARHAMDGNPGTAWRSVPGGTREQTLTVDFGEPREFGGLALRWAAGSHATRYDIDYSEDGQSWRTVRSVHAGNGRDDPHRLPESETRYLRLRMREGVDDGYALTEVEIKDLDWGATPNAFLQALARASPRGLYPRAYLGEQSYWTVLGVDGGTRHGLLSEDGALEFGPQTGSIEPFLLTEEGLVSWAQADITHSLLDGYLPVPTVIWRKGDWTMRVTAFGMGDRERSQLLSRYEIENRSKRTRRVTLVLAVRPMQVNPPAQFLNKPGGAASIRELSWNGAALRVNGTHPLHALQRPDHAIVARFESGRIDELLAQAPTEGAVSDETGLASAVLLYRLELPPGGRRSIGIVAPLAGAPELPETKQAGAWMDEMQARVAAHWREKLDRIVLHLPAEGTDLARTLRTAVAHILLSRAGPALQPGTRAYARSWVRDGAMMSEALSRLGHAAVAREYIAWFAPRQFSSGKVPCCVDGRGSDPVAENDSNGAFLHMIARHYRYTGDRAWLESLWPRVAAAAEYLNVLRLQERTPRNRSGERQAYYGLMPASISHEGYSDKPAYSYWDDFWALAGYDGAVEIARALGRDIEAQRIAAHRDEFREDLRASLRASIARHRIGFIPGSADRGDFDPTSTTIALSIAGEQANLPQRVLEGTFERYWREFVTRRESRASEVYTPYELRNVGAFVRLGWRQRAWALLEFFLADRRPAAWNQWAEVVGREPRHGRFIGDMPHGWVASDFINAVLDMLAYERRSDGALVLGAGLPPEWIERGVRIEGLRTPYGTLTYDTRRAGQRVELKLAGNLTMPHGGLVFPWPYPTAPGRVRIEGRPAEWENGKELRIRALPATVSMEVPADRHR